MMEYFNYKKAKKHVDHAEKSEEPVLTDEDEAFLHRIAEEGTPPELPERPEQPPPLPARPQDLPVAGEAEGNNAQIALMNGAQNIPLPEIPDTPEGTLTAVGSADLSHGIGKVETVKEGKRPSKWSWHRRDSRDRNRKTAATDLMSAAEGLKAANAQPNEEGQVTDHEAKKEEEEMTTVLEQLNLAAVNNRVFSISKESQELLHKFTLVLKDLVNGVPTAYDDLESLLTNSENQLQRSYAHLPPFLQKLIEQLPSKMTKSIGPEILAAAAEKQGIKSKHLQQGAAAAEKMGFKMKAPSLKDLVTKPGAVAGMLRAIMNFLKLRFPAFLGMNVLYSLALFVLLFVFWYCHKRGKEVRLEKERLLTEQEMAALDAQIAADGPHPTTFAPSGAPIEEVEAGMHPEPERIEEGYAAGGSLAKDLAKEKQAGNVNIEIKEVEGSVQGSSAKKEKWWQKWEAAPSKASLDRQESCVIS